MVKIVLNKVKRISSRASPSDTASLGVPTRISSLGVSPLIATVLLIAFTVAVAGVVSLWLTGFASESTELVASQSSVQLYCADGGMSVTGVTYCNGRLAGTIEKTGLADLGNITIQVLYQNATPPQTIFLAQNGSNITGASEMVLISTSPIATFNVSILGDNYDRIHVFTNCSNVYDDVPRSYVTQTC